MNSLYSRMIQRSDEDQCYVVSLPDFADRVAQPCTHGDTYEEAARHGQEVIHSYLEFWQEEGQPLPTPKTFPAEPL